MASRKEMHHVYIKLVEAKDIIGVESDGTSDPMVEMYVDGHKREELTTKRIRGTLAPQWHQEFCFTTPSDSPSLTFKLLDWKRIKANVKLGSVTINLGDYTQNTFHDLWLKLDTVGSLHVYLQTCTHLSPLSILTAPVLNYPLPKFRLQLERVKYYPGDVMRGAVVLNLRKPLRNTSFISLSFQCHSHSCPPGSDIVASSVAFKIGASNIMQSPTNEGTTVGAGCHIYPFEFTLPMGLAPSHNDKSGELQQTRYTLTTGLHFAGDRETQLIDRIIHILPPTSHWRRKPDCLLPPGYVGEHEKHTVLQSVSGPSQVWSGETYTFSCRLDNHHGSAGLEALKVRILASTYLNSGLSKPTGSSKMTRVLESTLLEQLEIVETLPHLNLPLAPGQQWEGKVTVKVAPKLTFMLGKPFRRKPPVASSLHCTHSPLIQLYHHIIVEAYTEPIPSPPIDSWKYPVFVLDRIGAPVNIIPHETGEPTITPGIIWKLASGEVSPDDTSYHPSLVPTPYEFDIAHEGRPFPPLSHDLKVAAPTSIPGAASHVYQFPGWTYGSIPDWIANNSSLLLVHDTAFTKDSMYPPAT